MFKYLLVLSVCIALCLAQDNTTATDVPTTETTQEPTTEATNSTVPSTTVATTTELTTEVVTSTSTHEPTTSAAPYDPTKPTVVKFVVKKDSNDTDACLKLEFALMMDIKYKASFSGKDYDGLLSVAFPADNSYDGVCGDKVNSLRVHFWNDWTLEMEYTLADTKYQLSSIRLDYFINSTWFPNATESGMRTVNNSDLHEFQANKGNSYKCSAKTTLKLDNNTSFDFTNYQAEPFFAKKASNDYDVAVECPADVTGTSKLVPIIVGSALAVLIVFVLIAYLIGRRRHRSGYQTV